MKEKKDISKFATNEMQLVDFRIFETRDNQSYEGIYGINVAKVEGIVVFPEHIFELPAAPDYVLGTFDLRGDILPLVDLATWMRVCIDPDKDKNRKVIITTFNNIRIGFVIHEARRIRRISWKNIEGATFNHDSQRGKITGTTRIENERTLLILDLEGIIDDLDFYNPMKTLTNNDGSKKEIPQFSGLVLILDDSLIARKLLRTSLGNVGFDIIEAVDGEDGMQKLENLSSQYGDSLQDHLKLIISDVEMPKMDGFHFATQIKQDVRFSHIPIIFNSSICDNLSEEKSKQIGANAYLVKFDPNVFYDEISRILLR
ncbi:MAG: chemotaxis protein CheW [Helicobacter sp.]|uniref:chemotaxis protein CheV n=1 Tax=Helicobacter sp. 10-6591 TaxID=2004998 RepID=UPI000DCF4BC3|nr:chemotaxis protein CheV [Helicobacter sp. 10-6591]MCI6217853.1 chemotaxis protein CheW [Helicobacter sp.]MCI7485297.1 chemotaxis protein CheW [Helicobacter sp.]MDD7567601.1 chemotaxis protein CheV [Helicobacter sp.]MDY5740928.1 chemotaxis protein CheV [Helicobacter sp.]RAX55720.1 fused signal transduction protein/response regulator [Helicobacter sp. 10-6591]